ncbi:hypothetical protein D3C80_2020510 [compost metagenome]
MLCNGSFEICARPASTSSLSLTSGTAGVTVKGRSSPMGMGLRLRSASLKTPISAWDNTLYLPSLTEEIEYITTKKANSKVMKSA